MKIREREEPAGPAPARAPGPGRRISLPDSALILLAAAAAGLFLKTFVVGACRVGSGSMENTLLPGDYVLVDKLSALFPSLVPLRRGDVLVFRSPGPDPATGREELYVKRCVAGPGDTVGLEGSPPCVVPGRGMHVSLTPATLEDWRYLIEREGHTVGFLDGRILLDGSPATGYTVEQQYYYLVGDNRARSVDSRTWGPVPARSILGKAVMIYWSAPLRAGRIGTLIR